MRAAMPITAEPRAAASAFCSPVVALAAARALSTERLLAGDRLIERLQARAQGHDLGFQGRGVGFGGGGGGLRSSALELGDRRKLLGGLRPSVFGAARCGRRLGRRRPRWARPSRRGDRAHALVEIVERGQQGRAWRRRGRRVGHGGARRARRAGRGGRRGGDGRAAPQGARLLRPVRQGDERGREHDHGGDQADHEGADHAHAAPGRRGRDGRRRRRARSVRAAAERLVSVMGVELCTPGGGSRSISSSTAWRVGRSAATAAKGNAASGSAAAGLMATAVMLRQVSARPASDEPDDTHPTRAARRTSRHRARGPPARRVPIRAARRLRAPRRARRAGSRTLRARACRRDRGDIGAGDMEKRAVRGVEPLAHEVGQGRPVARRRGDGAEAQPLGGRGGRVADGEDRLAALLARFGQRARAVGAGDQHGLAVGQRRGEVGGRMQHLQPEQRRDDRRMAALAQRLWPAPSPRVPAG